MTKINIDSKRLPKHIAIIMDGNGRWAKMRNQPRVFGHREGARSVRKDFEASAKSGAKSASDLAKINQEFANNANELTKQMAALSSNLETLNGVYGGVLNAMNRK